MFTFFLLSSKRKKVNLFTHCKKPLQVVSQEGNNYKVASFPKEAKATGGFEQG
jgi:hypothetical protein